METCVEVQNLTKAYHGRMVMDHLTFRIQKGEVFGLLGHNGAGKSTTIDCMLGYVKADSGTALIFGKEAQRHRFTLFQDIGVQLQQTGYQNNIRVKEICEEIASLYRKPRDYYELLTEFQLDHVANQSVQSLSGGERQKLSVLLALIPNPKLLFLDELTTGLDVEARREVWQLLYRLKQNGMTIFLTTHYMEEAQYLCDRLMILKQGKEIVCGTVEELIAATPYDSLEEAYLWYVKEEQQ